MSIFLPYANLDHQNVSTECSRSVQHFVEPNIWLMSSSVRIPVNLENLSGPIMTVKVSKGGSVRNNVRMRFRARNRRRRFQPALGVRAQRRTIIDSATSELNSTEARQGDLSMSDDNPRERFKNRMEVVKASSGGRMPTLKEIVEANLDAIDKYRNEDGIDLSVIGAGLSEAYGVKFTPASFRTTVSNARRARKQVTPPPTTPAPPVGHMPDSAPDRAGRPATETSTFSAPIAPSNDGRIGAGPPNTPPALSRLASINPIEPDEIL